VLQIGIVPRDLEQSIRFYRDTLGLNYVGARPVMLGRTLHLFDCDGGILKLLQLPDGVKTPTDQAPPGPFQSATGMRWATMNVDDINPYLERCGAERVQVPVTEVRPGVRMAIVEDPDGNAIELVERHS
jgi:catechol 2,3-dioxygenase-like lactoylglutathione lyase family enzyme